MLAGKDSIIGPYWIPIRMIANNNAAKAPGAPKASQAVRMNNAKQASTDPHAMQKPKIMEPSFLTQCSISNNDLRHYFWDLECTDHVHYSPPPLLTPCHSELGPSALQFEHMDTTAPCNQSNPGPKHALNAKSSWTQSIHGLMGTMDLRPPWGRNYHGQSQSRFR